MDRRAVVAEAQRTAAEPRGWKGLVWKRHWHWSHLSSDGRGARRRFLRCAATGGLSMVSPRCSCMRQGLWGYSSTIVRILQGGGGGASWAGGACFGLCPPSGEGPGWPAPLSHLPTLRRFWVQGDSPCTPGGGCTPAGGCAPCTPLGDGGGGVDLPGALGAAFQPGGGGLGMGWGGGGGGGGEGRDRRRSGGRDHCTLLGGQRGRRLPALARWDAS